MWQRAFNTTTFAAIVVVATLLHPSALAVSLETVWIGDAGNSNDPATGDLYGGVNYNYRISKFEVTVGQYAEFLNAVGKGPNYSGYDFGMQNYGLIRSGSSGNFSYTVTTSPNHPIGYVTWADAARFVNWLHNGQPTGPQNASTTEDGAYTLNGAINSEDLNSITRNPNAKWFLPNESEWYKAAYYQPTNAGGDVDGYWKYPMKTNNVPYSDQPPGVTPDNSRVGNFSADDGIANGYDDGYAVPGTVETGLSDLSTDVGAYSSSRSYYDTYDQGGNAGEWTETFAASFFGSRVVRGGSFLGVETSLAAWGSKAFLAMDVYAAVTAVEVVDVSAECVRWSVSIARHCAMRSCASAIKPARPCKVLGLPTPKSFRMIRPKLCAAAAIK